MRALHLFALAATTLAAATTAPAQTAPGPLQPPGAWSPEASPIDTLGKPTKTARPPAQPRGVTPNDACAGALLVAVPSTTAGSTAGGQVDSGAPSCPGAIISAPGVWYSFVGTGRVITVSTCPSLYDTQLTVYCGSCASLTCVAANDDACSGGGSTVSFCSEVGRGYFVLVHGYGGDAGEFTLQITQGTTTCAGAPACERCTISIPPDAVPEGEPACGPGHIDIFNAGCNSNPPRFSSLTLGQAISGRAGTYTRDGLAYRDTDWYEFTLDAPARVTWEGAGEFPLRLGLIDGNNGCRTEERFDYGTSLAPACQPVSVSAILAPGRYIAWAGPAVLSGVPCGSVYYARLTGVPAGACRVNGDAGCAVLTEDECASLGGVYEGHGTTCPEVNYFATATASAFEDIAGTGSLIVVGDDAGATIPIGFVFGFYSDLWTSLGVSPNGYLSFTDALDNPANEAIPSPTPPNTMIAPRWDNLNPSAGGSVRYELRGAAPTRRLIVQWTGVPQFGRSDANTFQAVLFEADGAIEFRYAAITLPQFTGDFSVGVEDRTGTRGLSIPATSVVANSAIALRKGSLVAPVAVAGGPYQLSATQPQVVVSARQSFDPDAGVPGFDGIRAVQWDLGADGTSDDAGRTNPEETITLAEALSKGLALDRDAVLRLAVTDADGLGGVDDTAVQYSNSAPGAQAGGPYEPIGPGECLQVAGVPTDADLAFPVGESLTVEWDDEPALTASDVGEGYAHSADACIPYAVLAQVASTSGYTLYFNVKDRAGAVASSAVAFSLRLPDLRVTAITAPAQAQVGQSVQISWTVTNAGDAPAPAGWRDAVFFSSDAQIGNDSLLTSVTRQSPLGVGQSYTASATVTMPGAAASYWLVVRTDSLAQLLEQDESNNTSIDDAPVMVLPGPDLVVEPGSIDAPGTAIAGQPMPVQFAVRNQGGAPATGSWRDRVSLATQQSGGVEVGLTSIRRDGPLAPGGSYQQAASGVVPITEEGLRYVVVTTDAENSVPEGVGEGNNRAVRAVPVLIQQPPLPDLVVTGVTHPPEGVAGQVAPIGWTVENQGDVPAGSSASVWFDRVYFSLDRTLGPDDVDAGPVSHVGELAPGGSYDGTAQVQLSAAPGVYYVLVVTNSRGDIEEGARRDNNTTASAGTMVIRPRPRPDLRVVGIVPPAPAAPLDPIEVRWTVQNAGTVPATSQWIERVYASPDAQPGNDVLLGSFILGDDLEPGQQIERVQTVTVPDLATSYHLVVCVDAINSIDESDETNNCASATSPSQIVRPDLVPGAVTAPATATADTAITVSWQVANTSTSQARGSWVDTVYIRPEGQPGAPDTVLGSALRAGGLAPGATYPGQLQVTVPGRIQGPWRIFVRTDAADALLESAETNNVASAPATTSVEQPDRPNLVVTSITPPPGGLIGQSGTVEWTVRNTGPATAAGAWTDRVLARNIETNEETVLGERFASGPLAAGASYTGSLSVTYPAPFGTYRISVITDRADNVNEGLSGGELDNRAADDSTFLVSGYSVHVAAENTTYPAGAPVPLTGHAQLSDGTRLASTSAELQVRVRGQVRSLSVVTNESGNFTTAFTPLPTEGGRYTLRAGPPGDVTNQDQDAFSIYSMTIEPPADFVQLIPGVPATRHVRLRNQGDEPITGLSAQVIGAPDGVEIDVDFSQRTIPPLGFVDATANITAEGAPAGPFQCSISFQSAQSNAQTLALNANVVSPLPELRATPGSLVTEMVRGTQTLVTFEVRNIGGAPATGLELLVPDTPWLSTPTIAVPDLAPGASAPVTLQLLPATDLPLGTYNGAVVIRDQQGIYGVSVPFSFTAASDRRAALTVRVQDEYTYWSTGTYNPDGPLVPGARVTLLDPEDRSVVAEQVTSAGQPAVFPEITEDYYTVRVEAADRGTYTDTVLVSADAENEILAFLPIQTVRYEWTVTPTDIEDNAVINLVALFETNVPVPVVTLDPPLIDLASIEGDSAQIDLTITNHGLITAENVRLNFGSHPNWRFTPLVGDLGNLSGGSVVTVPLLIERLNDQPSPPCSINAGLTWELVCIGRNQYLVPLIFINVTPGCGGSTPPGGPGGCFCGGPGRGGPGEPFVIQPVYPSPQECEPCDPLTYEPFCFLEADLSSLFAPAKPAIEGIFNRIPNISDVEVEFESEASLCTCCEEGGIGMVLSGFAEGRVSGTINLVGVNVQMPPLEVPIGNGRIATITASGSLGCRLPFQGALRGEASTGCSLRDPSACLSGSFNTIVSCGVTLNVMVAIPGLPECTFQQELTINTGVSGSIQWCTSGFQWQICFEGVYLNAGLGFSCGEFMFPGIDQRVYLIPRACADSDSFAPPAMNDAHVRAAIDDILARVPRVVGRGSTMPASLRPRGDGVCAQVLVQLEQRIAVTRSAFTASLTIENPSSTESLQDILVNFDVFDAQGSIATDRFVIMPPVLTNLSGVGGDGVIPPGALGRATWLIVPLPDAAPMADTEYTVGGALAYRLGALSSVAPLFPAPITVRPDPRLQLKYFWQRDVFGDDPFTLEPEPAEPFSVGLLLRNDGYGPARNVRITSGQPTIIDNDRGLLVEFNLVATQVGADPVTPALTVSLGDVLPDQTVAARWLLTSSLQGQFTQFSAQYEHRTSLGDPRLAIFDGLDIFQLIHAVRAPAPDDDFVPDFMTNEVTYPNDPFEDPSDFDRVDLPDTVHLSTGNTVAAVVPVLNANVTILEQGPQGQPRARVVAPMPATNSYAYIKFPDPFGGAARLVRVQRDDASELVPGFNAWQTDRSFRTGNERPARLNRVHLFDRGGPGIYTLTFAADADAPALVGWTFEADHGDTVGAVPLVATPGQPFVECRRGASQRIVASFTEPLDPSSWNADSVTISGRSLLDDSPVDLASRTITVRVGGNGSTGVLEITPPLPDNAQYRVVAVGIRDLSGNPITQTPEVGFVQATGDVSADRLVSDNDAAAVRHLVPTRRIDRNDQEQVRADVNADGEINDKDLRLVLSLARPSGPANPPPISRPPVLPPWRIEAITEAGMVDEISFSARTRNDRGYSITSVPDGAGGHEAVLVAPGGAQTRLGTLGGRFSVPLGLNNRNQVVGYSETAAGEIHAFRYTPAGPGTPAEMLDLGTLGGRHSWAISINEYGECAGASTTGDDASMRAFVHDGRVIANLTDLLPPDSGWTLSEALDISDSRRVRGIGRLHGQPRVFQLDLVPLDFDDISRCVADFDRNGRLESLDLFAFLQAFLAGDKSADINGDEIVGSDDYLTFLTLFFSGCE